MSELGQKQTFEKRTATSAPFQFRITAGMAQGRSAGEIHSASGVAPFEGLAQQNSARWRATAPRGYLRRR